MCTRRAHNCKPTVRLRRAPFQGIINRYGFNNDGVGKVQKRVRAARAEWMDDFAMFGINIANNKLTNDARLVNEIFCDSVVQNR